MIDTNYQEATKEAVKAKFRGRKNIVPSVIPRYPESAEREYKRLAKAYAGLLGAELSKKLPEILKAYEREMRKDSKDIREDGIMDFLSFLGNTILDISDRVMEGTNKFGLGDRLEKVSRMAQKKNIDEWKRLVKKTLGVDLLDDYYKSEIYEQAIKLWLSDNSSQIQNIPNETLLRIQNVIADGFRKGKKISDLRREIRKEYKFSRWKAEALAKDQMASLNSKLTQLQHRDAGVRKYLWKSLKDSRVRDAHREFNGRIFSWDSPPEDWYMTKSRGRVYTGHRYHPGEAYGCRCVAEPVFEFNSLNLPIR